MAPRRCQLMLNEKKGEGRGRMVVLKIGWNEARGWKYKGMPN